MTYCYCPSFDKRWFPSIRSHIFWRPFMTYKWIHFHFRRSNFPFLDLKNNNFTNSNCHVYIATHAYILYTISVRAIYQSLCFPGYPCLGLVADQWVPSCKVKVITSKVLRSLSYLNQRCIRSRNLVIQFSIPSFVNFTQLKE